MRYDTSVTGKMIEHYKDLAQFNALDWKGGVDSDKALRYCINVIDSDSPVYRMLDIEARTTKAAELAGFAKVKGGKFSAPVQFMIEGYDEKVNEMMFVLMGIYHDTLFELWYSSKLSIHYLMKTLRTPPKDLTSKQMTEEARIRASIEKDLNGMITEQMSRESKIFRDENLKRKVAGIVMAKNVNYPEAFAEDITHE